MRSLDALDNLLAQSPRFRCGGDGALASLVARSIPRPSWAREAYMVRDLFSVWDCTLLLLARCVMLLCLSGLSRMAVWIRSPFAPYVLLLAMTLDALTPSAIWMSRRPARDMTWLSSGEHMSDLLAACVGLWVMLLDRPLVLSPHVLMLTLAERPFRWLLEPRCGTPAGCISPRTCFCLDLTSQPALLLALRHYKADPAEDALRPVESCAASGEENNVIFLSELRSLLPKYRDSPPISTMKHLQKYATLWLEVAYTPNICITLLVPFVSRYFCWSIWVRGRWNTPIEP